MGASHLLLQISELGFIKGIISDQVRVECERNIKKKNPSALPAFKSIITQSFHEIINPNERVLTQVKEMAHKKDVPILAAAVEGEVDLLVTFNKKDFPPYSLTSSACVSASRITKLGLSISFEILLVMRLLRSTPFITCDTNCLEHPSSLATSFCVKPFSSRITFICDAIK